MGSNERSICGAFVGAKQRTYRYSHDHTIYESYCYTHDGTIDGSNGTAIRTTDNATIGTTNFNAYWTIFTTNYATIQ